MGAIEKMWYNEGGVATIVPLKMLERIFPISYQSHKGMNPGHFVIHSDQGDIVVKNNGAGMPYGREGARGGSRPMLRPDGTR
jgi:hypothetical protein